MDRRRQRTRRALHPTTQPSWASALLGVRDGRIGRESRIHVRTKTCLSCHVEDRLSDGLFRSLESDVLVNLRPPRLVLVREPDLLRVEGADQPLAFGARLVELGKEDRHVAADDH